MVASLALAENAAPEERWEVTYEDCKDPPLPAGVASVDCKGAKCKSVCEPGKYANGKKSIKCKYVENTYGVHRWNGKLGECVGCEAPTSDDANVSFSCRVNKKGVNLCSTKCANGGELTTEDWDESISKAKLQCSCPKVEGVRECGWKYDGDEVDTAGLTCIGGSDTTTTKKTTKPTDAATTTKPATDGTSAGTTTTKATTAKPTDASTAGTTTTKATTKTTTTTTKATTKTTTTKATTTTTKATTTTTKATTTTTKATTTQAPTQSTAAGVDCTPNTDGTCGNPKALETYLFVNFEGESMTNQQVTLDPRLMHLDHINQNAYVGVGNGLTSFSNPKSQTVMVRVDRCPNFSSYENPSEAELGVTTGTVKCEQHVSWVYKGSSTKHNMVGMVATSPDGTYVLAAGVKEKNNNAHARWIIKLDAATGAVIWEIEMPTNNSDGLSKSKQSGYESIGFTKDGGFIVGGWADHEGGFPSFKSGGQVDMGYPIFQKFGANVAKRTTAFASAPTPKWTFKCDATNCPNPQVGKAPPGSMKTLRVFMDNGVEKVASAPGVGADVIVVNAADGTKSAYGNFDSVFQGNFQDVEPLIVGGKVTGYGVTGLNHSNTLPKGQGGCVANGGCETIYGHTTFLKPDLSGIQWSKTYNDFTGGTGAYAGLTSLSPGVVITECWGLTTTVDANGDGTGFAAACGQGIEGCKEYLNGFSNAMMNTCEKDVRKTWRGAAVHHDAAGNMVWYRNDNSRAYEFVDRGPNGALVFLSDKPIGFGFATLAP